MRGIESLLPQTRHTPFPTRRINYVGRYVIVGFCNYHRSVSGIYSLLSVRASSNLAPHFHDLHLFSSYTTLYLLLSIPQPCRTGWCDNDTIVPGYHCQFWSGWVEAVCDCSVPTVTSHAWCFRGMGRVAGRGDVTCGRTKRKPWHLRFLGLSRQRLWTFLCVPLCSPAQGINIVKSY